VAAAPCGGNTLTVTGNEQQTCLRNNRRYGAANNWLARSAQTTSRHKREESNKHGAAAAQIINTRCRGDSLRYLSDAVLPTRGKTPSWHFLRSHLYNLLMAHNRGRREHLSASFALLPAFASSSAARRAVE